jgi:small subunit ribosomal protein S19e
MTTYHDVPADLLIAELATRLQSMDQVSAPEWADYVKTGSHRERPPVQADWWYVRSAAVFRKVGMMGPIGANHMAQQFGGPKDRGVKQNRAVSGSRNIARTILQQLSACDLIISKHNLAGTVNLGKILTGTGQSMLDDAAHAVRGSAEERYPGLSGF